MVAGAGVWTAVACGPLEGDYEEKHAALTEDQIKARMKRTVVRLLDEAEDRLVEIVAPRDHAVHVVLLVLHRAEQDRRRTTEQLLNAPAGSRRTLQLQERLETLRVRLHDQQHSLQNTDKTKSNHLL